MSFHKKPNGKYIVRVYGLPAKTFDTRREAVAYHAQLENFKTNKPNAVISNKTLFTEVARRYLESVERNKEYNTYKNYESRYRIWIKPILETLQIGNITPVTINRFQDQIKEKGIGNSTYDHVNIVLYEILNFAAHPLQRFIVDNPMSRPERKQAYRKPLSHLDYLSVNEVEKLLDCAKNSPYYDSIVFILNTGLRFSEFSCLQKDSFDFNSNTVGIYQQLCLRQRDGANYYIKSTKGKEYRSMSLNAVALKIVKDLVKSGRSKFLFCPGNTEEKTVLIKNGNKERIESHKILTNRTFAYALEAICTKAGVKVIGPHGLRHTFSAHFLMNGGSIFTLSKYLGHKSVNTTIENYGHLSDEFLAMSANIVSFGESR